MFIPRIISAIFGTASIYIIYKTSLQIFPKRKMIALITVIILTFSITHLQISDSAKPWMPSLFFYSLSIYFCLKYYFSSNNKYWLLSTFCLSVALGFHFAVFFGWFFLGIIILIKKFIDRKPVPAKNWIILLLPLAAFIFFYSTIKYSYHEELFSTLTRNFHQGILNSFIYYLQELFLSEPLSFVFVFGCFIWIASLLKIAKAMFIYNIFYFLIITVTWQKSNRYLLPIIIYLPIFFGYFINQILTTIKNKFSLIIVPLIILSIIPGIYWLYVYLQPPTFIEAMNWSNKEIAPEIPIASNSIRFSAFVPSLTTITAMQQTQPNAYKQLQLLLPADGYPDNVRNIYYLEKIIDVRNKSEIIKFTRNNHIAYIYDYYWNPDESLLKFAPQTFILTKRFSPTPDENLAVTNLLHGSGNILKLVQINKFGPYIDVLKIR